MRYNTERYIFIITLIFFSGISFNVLANKTDSKEVEKITKRICRERCASSREMVIIIERLKNIKEKLDLVMIGQESIPSKLDRILVIIDER